MKREGLKTIVSQQLGQTIWTPSVVDSKGYVVATGESVDSKKAAEESARKLLLKAKREGL